MTDEEKKQLAVLEARMRQLMFLHDDLKRQNTTLTQALAENEETLQKLQKEYTNLEANYTDLKQARIISIHDADVEGTKQRLSKLVREIDKCLALLNG